MEPMIVRDGGAVIVTTPRRFDVDSAPLVESGLKPFLADKSVELIFDFSKTEYISSAGMRVILAASRQVRSGGGTVHLAALGRQAEYIFEISGFKKMFPVHENRKKALLSLQEKEKNAP